MKHVKLYEQFINEASVPSNIKEFAKRKGITSLVNKVAGWAEKVGARISGGTAIGKDYGTLVLDMKYQAGEIRINTDNETIKLFNEPVTSLAQFKKVYAEVTEVDESNIKVNEHDFKVGDKVKMSHGGSGVVKSLDKESGADDEKYYNIELPNGDVMKHAPNELTKESEVNEKEVNLFDEVGPELEALRSKISGLMKKSEDDKWTSALGKAISALSTLDKNLSQADSKLGVVPVTESEVNEAITVLADRYVRSHGKNPKGFGKWMFSYNKSGEDVFEMPNAMLFADAVKWVKDKAKEDGESYIYVME